MFERIRRAFGILNSMNSIPQRRRRTDGSVFGTQPEFLETRDLLTPKLVGAMDSVSEQKQDKAAKKGTTAPNIVGTWELTGSGFVGYLIVNSQTDKTFSAILSANANFTFPEIHFEGKFRGTKLTAPKFRQQAVPVGSFAGKLSVQIDTATTLHGQIGGKNNGAAFKFQFTGVHISDV